MLPLIFPPIKDDILPQKVLLATPTISLTADIVGVVNSTQMSLPDKSQLVESLELYSCAESLLAAKTLRIVMGVTNQVGPRAHEQWVDNFKQVALMTRDYILRHHSKINSVHL